MLLPSDMVDPFIHNSLLTVFVAGLVNTIGHAIMPLQINFVRQM